MSIKSKISLGIIIALMSWGLYWSAVEPIATEIVRTKHTPFIANAIIISFILLIAVFFIVLIVNFLLDNK